MCECEGVECTSEPFMIIEATEGGGEGKKGGEQKDEGVTVTKDVGELE